LSERFTLITGRTREQGSGLHKGKTSPEYRRAIERAEMNREDMARLRIEEGGAVRLSTAEGEVEMPAFAGDVPTGVLFVPMGAPVNALVNGDTSGTGMPSFKGVGVTVEPA
jgi:formylmethanofuran dehydrogenase subunit D